MNRIITLILLTFGLNGGLFDFYKYAKINSSYKSKDYNTTKEVLLSLSNDSAVYHYNLGSVYYNLGRYNEAIKEFKRAFGKEVDEHNRLHNLGNCYFKIKEYKKAILVYEYALKIRSDKDTSYNLALAKEALKNLQKQKEPNKQKKREKSSKKSNKKSQKKHKEAQKLTKKDLKALNDLKKRLEQKEQLKKMLKKSFKEKKVPVIMYPLDKKEPNSKQPW